MKCQWCGKKVHYNRHQIPVSYIDQKNKKIIPKVLRVCGDCKAEIHALKKAHNQDPDKPAVLTQ
jgi:hypothetical protein